MGNNVQVILKDGRPEYAVVPYKEYEQLVEAAEMLADVQSYDAVKQALVDGEDELVPSEVVDALLDGENPLRVWRRHRSMTQATLAEQVGISKAYLSQLETGKRTGTADLLARLAAVLGVTVDELI